MTDYERNKTTFLMHWMEAFPEKRDIKFKVLWFHQGLRAWGLVNDE